MSDLNFDGTKFVTYKEKQEELNYLMGLWTILSAQKIEFETRDGIMKRIVQLSKVEIPLTSQLEKV